MILDGKAYSNKIINELQKFYSNNPTKKRLAIISVGDDYGNKIYCNMKKNTAEKIGIRCDVFNFKEVKQEDLEQLVTLLSREKNVAGIMIQHPLPNYLQEQTLLDLIPVSKDVDGLSTESLGRILTNNKKFVPATALGIINLLKHYNIDLVGKKVLVVGRSQIVGLPLSNMFVKENATVTIAHSKTKNLQDMIKDFDIVVAAIGKAEYLKAEWFKEGQILIDAGYNKGNVGDIDHLAYEKASFHTPVPGGVGPMTVASLMLQLHDAIQLHETNFIDCINNKENANIKPTGNLLYRLMEKELGKKFVPVPEDRNATVASAKKMERAIDGQLEANNSTPKSSVIDFKNV